jgi:hypothetical protein
MKKKQTAEELEGRFRSRVLTLANDVLGALDRNLVVTIAKGRPPKQKGPAAFWTMDVSVVHWQNRTEKSVIGKGHVSPTTSEIEGWDLWARSHAFSAIKIALEAYGQAIRDRERKRQRAMEQAAATMGGRYLQALG